MVFYQSHKSVFDAQDFDIVLAERRLGYCADYGIQTGTIASRGQHTDSLDSMHRLPSCLQAVHEFRASTP
jgi:hypothetical protein